MNTNAGELIAWLHNEQVVADKQGILLIDSSHIPQSDSSPGDGSEAVTVQSKLVGNLLAFWDCTLDQETLRRDSKATHLVVLERALLQLCEPTAHLPYPFTISFAYDQSQFRFSAFAEEERETWVQCLSQASSELAFAKMDALASGLLNLTPDRDVSPDAAEPIAPPDLNEKKVSGLLDNWMRRRHELKASNKRTLVCEEWMVESKLSIVLPCHLLKLYRQWTQELKADLDGRLAYLPASWNSVRLAHIRLLTENTERYNEALEFLDAYTGPYFRPSLERCRVAFAFAPINLHVQRFYILVQEQQAEPKWQPFDFITSGACAAFPLRYPNGGSIRLRKKLHGALASKEAVDSIMESRFWSRKAVLLDAKRRCDSLVVEILRSWTGEIAKFREGKAGWFLLSQVKEIRTLLQDWVHTFPQISQAVAELVELASRAPANQDRRVTGPGAQLTLEKTPTFVPSDLLENQWDTLDALVVSLSTKIAAFDTVDTNNAPHSFTFEQWIESAREVANKTVAQLETLCETLLDALLFRLIHSLHTTALSETYYSLQLRMDIVLSQTITTVCTGVLSRLWLADQNYDRVAKDWHKVGPLFTILSHLSCYGEEKGMLEDMCDGVRMVKDLCRFRCVRAFSTVSSPSCIPIIEGSRSGLIVTLPVPEALFQTLSPELQSGALFQVFSVIWNLGINHEAFFGQKLGDNALEKAINKDALSNVKTYVELILESNKTDELSEGNAALRRARSELTELEAQVKQRPSDKNVRILRLASDLTQALDGVVLLCCKSGKDRTSMAVTLEQTHILRENCGLPEHEIGNVVAQMRVNSIRRENCRKNIGDPMYAFSQLQIPFLPEEYRPPNGTFCPHVT